MDIMQLVKSMLSDNNPEILKSDKWDAVIQTHISLITIMVENHCNIDELPEKLFPVVAYAVKDHMENTESFKGVAKTSFGDTSVTYNTNKIGESVLMDMKSQLNGARVVKWR